MKNWAKRDDKGRFIKGSSSYWKNKKFDDKYKKKLSEKHKELCLKGKNVPPSRKGISPSNKGLSLSIETKIKLSKSLKGKLSKLKGRPRFDFRGEKHPRWKGGKEAWNWVDSFELNKWRKEVFKRDCYSCRMCGNKNEKGNFVYIEAHHIKKKSEYPELIYNINNGITLCRKCHNEIQWKEEEYEDIFYKMINNNSC